MAALLLLAAWSGSVPGKPLTIHLAGDSTLAEKRWRQRPETGWGESLQSFLNEDRAHVANHAVDGASTRTFIATGRWQALLDQAARGDYVFVQFGHNDEPRHKASHTSPDEYRSNLIRFVAEVRARQATPVLMTPIVRRRFDANGAFVDMHGAYPDIVREVASQQSTTLIDLHRASEALLKKLGPDSSRRLFLHLQPLRHFNHLRGIADDTHLSAAGAEAMARLAIAEMKKLQLPLAFKDLPGESAP